MDLSFLPVWPPLWPAAVALGALGLVSLALGEFAARWLHWPRLIGYLAAGAIFGSGAQTIENLHFEGLSRVPLESALGIAAAFVLFDLGQRVSFGWLRRNPAMLATSLVEAAATFTAVFFVMRQLGIALLPAALIAAISIATSPAVLLAVTRELRAQGQVTERALLLTALNCIYSVMLSTLLLAWVHLESRQVLDSYVLDPLYLIAGSLVLAACAAWLLVALLAAVRRDRALQIMTMAAMVAIVFGASQALRLSHLLTLLACGAFTRLFDRQRHISGTEFGLVSSFVLILYFALSAVTVDFGATSVVWQAALGLIGVRIVCKIAAATALAPIAGIGWRQGLATGVALAPMSTLSLLLAQQVGVVYAELGGLLMSVLVPGVVLLQSLGALALAFVIRRSGEARVAV